MQIGTATTENSMKAPQKLQTELPNDPAILLLGICSKEMKTESQRGICTATFIVILLTIAKIWKQPKCPSMNVWIQKVQYMFKME